jgi:hypothetical protein
MVAGCSEIGTATNIANVYSLNGFNDWYLPSYEEMSLMISNIGPLATQPLTNIAGFYTTYPENFYWTSTQHYYDYFKYYYSICVPGTGPASSICTSDPHNSGYGYVHSPLKVRAVRSF